MPQSSDSFTPNSVRANQAGHLFVFVYITISCILSGTIAFMLHRNDLDARLVNTPCGHSQEMKCAFLALPASTIDILLVHIAHVARKQRWPLR